MKTEALDYQQVTAGSKPIKTNKKPVVGETGLYKIRDIIAWCQAGQIVGYENNRGNGKAGKKTVESVRDNLDIESLGQIWLSLDDSNGRSTIVEGHGRILGLGLRHAEKGLTKEELDAIVAIRCVTPEKKLTTYQTTNKSQKHAIGQVIANRDLLFRNIIEEVLDRADLTKDDIYKINKSGNYQIWADIIVALHMMREEGYSVHTFADVYRVRKRVSKLAALTKEQAGIELTDDELNRFARGIEYYARYVQEVRKLEKEKGIAVYRQLNKAGWMGALISDVVFFSDRRLFYKDPCKIAENALKHCVTLSPILRNICGSDEGYTIDCIIRANNILRGRKVA